MTAFLLALSIGAACVLSFVALVARHPVTIVCTVVLGSFFTFPIYVFAQGYNSALLVTDAILAVAALRYVAGWRQGPYAQSPPWPAWAVAMVCMVIVSRLIVLARFPTVKSVQQLGFYSYRMVTMMGLFMLPACIAYTRRSLGTLLTVAVMGCGAVGLLGLLQYAGRVDLSFSAGWLVAGKEATDEEETIHVFLLGYNRKSLGLLMMMGSLMGVGLCSITRSRAVQALALTCTFLCFATLVGSLSRSSLIGLVGGVAILLIYLRLGQAALLTVFLSTVALVVFTVWGEKFGLTERYQALSSAADLQATGSARARLDAWASVIRYLLTHPLELLLGGGFLNYGAYYNRYLHVTVLVFAHNLYIHTVAELGLIGAAIFFGWYLRSAFELLKLRFVLPTQEPQRLFFGCMLGTLAGAFGAGVADDTLYPNSASWPFLQAFLPLLGAAMGYAKTWLRPGAFEHTAYDRVS